MVVLEEFRDIDVSIAEWNHIPAPCETSRCVLASSCPKGRRATAVHGAQTSHGTISRILLPQRSSSTLLSQNGDDRWDDSIRNANINLQRILNASESRAENNLEDIDQFPSILLQEQGT